MRGPRKVFVTGVLVLLLGACGSGIETSPELKTALQTRVATLRKAIDADKTKTATKILDSVRATVAQAEATGDIDEGLAAQILAATKKIESKLEPPEVEEKEQPDDEEEEDEDHSGHGHFGTGDDEDDESEGHGHGSGHD